jgi:hypothetical protein
MTEAEFAIVRKIRMMLRDPAGVNDLIFADSLPPEPDAQAGYYVAEIRSYKKFNARKNAWEIVAAKLSDAYILETVREKGLPRAAVCLIDFIIMGLQSGAISFSAGAESVTRASLRDQIELYQAQKKILEEQAGLNTGRSMRTRRPAVGGVIEAW